MARAQFDRDRGRRVKTIIRLAGSALIAVAIIFNPFVLGWLFSADGRITSTVNVAVIVSGEVIVGLVGILLAVKADAQAILFVISTLLALIVGDVGLNLVSGSVYKPTKYGWTPAENQTTRHSVHDQPGQFRTVENRYFKGGFKRWANPDSRRPKVLILGDSLTEMVQVSNGEEWYAYLERDFDTVEWFVYGAGGYSSLQEYLVLNDYIDQIKPSLILWQFTTNDYVDNSYEWDRKYYPFNNFGARAYLEHGEIVYRLPMPFPLLRKYSKLADLLLSVYDGKMKERARTIPRTLPHSDRIFDADSPLTEPEKEALFGLTRDILKMARERARGIPFLFLHHSGSQHDDREESLCAAAGMTCIPGLADYLERQKAGGETIAVIDDGHWNKAGNKYVGEYLVQYLRQNAKVQEVLTPTDEGH